MDVGEWDLKLLGLAISQSAESTSRTSAVDTLLHRGVDQKRVRLRTEVEVLGEGAFA